ncbi:DUF4231 domain-containing protein [Dyadobacter fanqingshengii]|uniref:DUF4231 domain-containing protein n=1 Tax=Dyadobacter fanqingshengii TaxID=2906443 RepID=A0A9X1T829_9BACT|nr:DUF4231 domain-containing protein [Dyadobacter fanqingshengii]MCF0039740.1 DUF4231 domain-containing protein [Dyadobacter fanqingshengii]USJ38498.1 DUF4231 domain-containing protein [Dyadobacter fanqingshengii]
MPRIAITGHRNLLEPSNVRESIKHSLTYFKTKYENVEAMSALAVGADTIFVEEAFKQQLPVRYFLPFSITEYRKDFDTAESLALFDQLLYQNKNAHRVVSDLQNFNQAERNEAYLAVGKHLVDEADIILAVWDGQPAIGTGGTGDVVAYARQQGKEVHIIRGLRTQSSQEADEVLFKQLDNAAIRYKERFFQPAWYLGLFLAIVGVVFFAIGLAFEGQNSQSKLNMAGFEVLCIVLSAILIVYIARPFKDRFLDNRRNAEFLRTIRWFKQANVPLPLIDTNSFSRTSKRRKSIAIRPEITALEKVMAGFSANPRDFNDSKRKLWIFAEDQIDYHERKRLRPLQTKEKRIHQILYGLTWVFYLSISFKMVIEIFHFLHEKKWHLPHLPLDINLLLPYLNVLLIVVPSVFAVLESVRAFEEWERNQDEAEKMKGELLEVQNQIFISNEASSLAIASRILRMTLEKENSAWTDRVASLTPGVHI